MNIFQNCPPKGCYANTVCDVEFKGRVIAASLIDNDYLDQIDTSSKQAWISSIFYQYLQGNAFLILNTSGEKPRPETAELPGTGLRINKPGAKTHTINLMDMQILADGNIDFYNKILRTSQNYSLYYFTPDLIWDATGEQITLIGDPVIADDLTSFIGGEATIKWVSNDNPLSYSFDTKTLLKGLFYLISGNLVLNIVLGGGETTSYTATLSQTLPSGSLPDLVWSFADGQEEVIEALGVTVDPVTGEVEFNAVETGNFTLTIVVEAETNCVYGTKDITVRVTAA